MYHTCGICKPRCNHPCKSRLYSPRWIECPYCNTYTLARNKKCIKCGAEIDMDIGPVLCLYTNELCDRPCGLVKGIKDPEKYKKCLYLEAKEQLKK